MPRKRNAIGAAAEEKMRALIDAGGTAASIAAALAADGVKGVSRQTVNARRLEIRRGPATAPPPRASGRVPAADDPPLPSSPEAIPENATISMYDAWIAKATRAGLEAEIAGDLSGIATMGRLVGSLLDLRRKATPLPKADPNDNPDMIAAAERARLLLHRYLDQALNVPPKES